MGPSSIPLEYTHFFSPVIRKGLCMPQTGRRAKRDDYSIRSPEPEFFFFLHPSISYLLDSWLRRSNLYIYCGGV
jgi:hypothetical protein